MVVVVAAAAVLVVGAAVMLAIVVLAAVAALLAAFGLQKSHTAFRRGRPAFEPGARVCAPAGARQKR